MMQFLQNAIPKKNVTITINLNGEIYAKEELNSEKSLAWVRKNLSNLHTKDGFPKEISEVKFLDKMGDVISQNDEENYKLANVLDNKNILYIVYKKELLSKLVKDQHVNTDIEVTIKIEEKPSFIEFLDISKGNEENYTLKQVLQSDEGKSNILKVKQDSSISESEINENCKLEYGIKIDGRPNEKAFEFKQGLEITIHDEPKHHSKSIRESIAYESNYNKDFSFDIKAYAKLPWLSANFAASYEQSKGRINNKKYDKSEDIDLKEYAVIKMDNVVPTEEFVKRVSSALKSYNSIEELKKVCNEYGDFWARKVYLGGKIEKIQTKLIESNVQTGQKTIKTDGGIGMENTLGANLQYNSTASKTDTDTKSIVESESIGRNIKNLDDYHNWNIIKYEDMVLIFEILKKDEKHLELYKQVLKTLGKKILHFEVRTLKPEDSELLKLNIPNKFQKENPENCQIFATIINNKCNHKGTFSVQVLTFSGGAFLKIHRVGKYNKRKYPLKICWGIIGIPTDFDLYHHKDSCVSGLLKLTTKDAAFKPLDNTDTSFEETPPVLYYISIPSIRVN
ncbi:13611_t:CDS:2 [Racocetra fulgida]|uniref:13611_t:CDS:1 n=1 Tax=Racocetra fulgida TaxID=60492 RepID=A0A9N9GCM9_9GLOM|nr:13611_t:CDS:2 [Racocetra fulgida]